MTTLAIACFCIGEEPGPQMVHAWRAHPLVHRVLLLGDTSHVPAVPGAQVIPVPVFFAGTTMQRLLEAWTEDYLCRRWSGNTDSALPLATAQRYDLYKDRLRTLEILARQRRNAASAGGA